MSGALSEVACLGPCPVVVPCCQLDCDQRSLRFHLPALRGGFVPSHTMSASSAGASGGGSPKSLAQISSSMPAAIRLISSWGPRSSWVLP